MSELRVSFSLDPCLKFPAIKNALLKSVCTSKSVSQRFSFLPVTIQCLHCVLRHLLMIKNTYCWASELAQRLSALVALGEDPGSIPTTHLVSLPVGNSSSRQSDILFWPWRAPGTCVVHIYACGQNTLTHRIIKEAHLKYFLPCHSFQNNLLGCKAMCFVCTSSHVCGIQWRIPLPKERI